MNADPLSTFPCWVCYAPEGATLRFDRKRGNPFVSCGVCGTRVFAKSRHHLRGIYITTKLVETLLAQVGGNPDVRAEREREAEKFVSAVRARLDAAAAAAAGLVVPGAPQEIQPHEHVPVSARR